jgi:hypothetical protein
MGTITRSFANNLTTGGVLKAGAFNDASLNNVTALNAAVATGNMVLLSSQTASASASISFTTGIDSTYKEYQFYFIDIHPATDNAHFQFNMSTDGGSSYNVTKTTTFFRAYHDEGVEGEALEYQATRDLAQSTSAHILASDLDNAGDASSAGSMSLYNPASTTFVKHFISEMTALSADYYNYHLFTAGYGNTTSAINAVQFSMSSGNIDDGTILMYGIL